MPHVKWFLRKRFKILIFLNSFWLNCLTHFDWIVWTQNWLKCLWPNCLNAECNTKTDRFLAPIPSCYIVILRRILLSNWHHVICKNKSISRTKKMCLESCWAAEHTPRVIFFFNCTSITYGLYKNLICFDTFDSFNFICFMFICKN